MANEIEISAYQNSFQNYKGKDTSIISTFERDFSLIPNSYIEFFVYNPQKSLLSSNLNYLNYDQYVNSLGEDVTEVTDVNISPSIDLQSEGYSQGIYVTYYNFLTKRVGDFIDPLFISQISSDRTEIRLDSNLLSSINLVNQTNDFIVFREQQPYFVDFYLNFGNNELLISNNIKLEDENSSNPTILIKLYNPLPSKFQLNDTLWVVTNYNEPEAYQVSFPTPSFSDQSNNIQLAGPNFSIPIKNRVNNSSQNFSKNDILLGAASSSYNQIQNIISSSNININVNYENYNDFIHFSSLETRLNNFKSKLLLVENYSSSLAGLEGVSSSFSSNQILEQKITNIISNFDGYEYFLYYTSGSKAWPKTTSFPPYTLSKTNSLESLTWLGSTNESNAYYGGQLISASNYDNGNPNELKKSIPEYIKEDSSNQPYDLFIDMVAQYYDNVWLYTKDITQKYNADNRLNFGVSKDLVADAIRDFGIKLYQNNFSNKELYTAFLGMTPEGSLFPFPEITGSMPVPTGMEFVDTLISASNDVISMDDTNKSLYKRLYHNIPYLLKTKGTLTGLRALITSYGIPDTILKISEFGGKDKVNANDYDLYFNNFNYALEVGPDSTNGNFLSSSFDFNSNFNATNDRPKTTEFRFKTEKFPPTNLSQSLFTLEYPGGGQFLDIVLEYSGSGLTSSSLYNGSIKDPNYQYGNLKLIPSTGTPNNSASIYLPFFDGNWWSVKLDNDLSTNFTMSAGNSIYNGLDGTSIGYFNSVTKTASHAGYANNTKMYLATSSLYPGFSGSVQELRCYKDIVSESVFKDYIMNPLSFEGNGVNSAPDQLMFRAALGSELDITTSSSIHPKVTGSWAITSSFTNNSNFYINNTPSYNPNTETFFLDQPAVGIKNRVNDKIKSTNNTLPSGNVLSPIRRLSQTIEASASYTDNINYLEVAFSPQNQINDDIIGQMGHFNIGDYIGDPAQRFSGNNYPDLNNLSEEYFKKYIKQYDLTDFVRLIKFFDNSLFKMIKDFIPAKTSLASGLVIKQHLLERNKYPQPQVSTSDESEILGSIQSKQVWVPTTETFIMSSSLIESFSGGAAGMFNEFNNTATSPSGSLGQGPNNIFNITQSWSVTTPTLSGSVTKIHDSQTEFYNGELSGSKIEVTNGELNSKNQFKNDSFKMVNYKLRLYYKNSGSNEDYFLNNNNSPTNGYISLYYGEVPTSSLSS